MLTNNHTYRPHSIIIDERRKLVYIVCILRDICTPTRCIISPKRLRWCFDRFGLQLVAVSLSIRETHSERQCPDENYYIDFINVHFSIPLGQQTCIMGGKRIVLHTGVHD